MNEKNVCKVDVKMSVDDNGEPSLAMLLRARIGSGTANGPNGEHVEFELSHSAGGAIVVEFKDGPTVSVAIGDVVQAALKAGIHRLKVAS